MFRKRKKKFDIKKQKAKRNSPEKKKPREGRLNQKAEDGGCGENFKIPSRGFT